MDQLIPSLTDLVVPFCQAFRIEVFQTLLAGWIVCLRPRAVRCSSEGSLPDQEASDEDALDSTRGAADTLTLSVRFP